MNGLIADYPDRLRDLLEVRGLALPRTHEPRGEAGPGDRCDNLACRTPWSRRLEAAAQGAGGSARVPPDPRSRAGAVAS